ncbi:MAG: hypothetical protein QM757_36320 [Paludibaculum sp.]
MGYFISVLREADRQFRGATATRGEADAMANATSVAGVSINDLRNNEAPRRIIAHDDATPCRAFHWSITAQRRLSRESRHTTLALATLPGHR